MVHLDLEELFDEARAQGSMSSRTKRRIDQAVDHHPDAHIEALRLWTRDGTVVYSTNKQDLGAGLKANYDVREALDNRIETELEGTEEDHGVSRKSEKPYIEVYVPLHLPGSDEDPDEVVGAAEFYLSAEGLAERTREARFSAWSSLALALALLYAFLFVVSWRASQSLLENVELSKANIFLERALAQKRESEEKFRSILENANDVIVLLDKAGTVTEVNRRIRDVTGYEPSEVAGRHFTKIPAFRGSTLTRATHVFRELMAGGSHIYELELRRRDGSMIPVEVSAEVVEEGGSIRGILALVRDISDRKRAEREREKLTGERLEAVSRTLEEAVGALGSMIEKRDPYTSGHQRRVAELAAAIGREMGLPDDQVTGIRVGALIHDAGRINIPAGILSKPGELTPEEFALARIHAEVGFHILNDVNFPWPVAEMAHQHHERMNGSGYPQGLSGDEILLEARILAVADVVEAIASHRPYRPAMGIEAALDEIRRNQGVLYDEQVVAACHKLFTGKGFAFTSVSEAAVEPA
ncbi:MAG: HD domain-containing phosphohydrolase [Terriglobia bacterium]